MKNKNGLNYLLSILLLSYATVANAELNMSTLEKIAAYKVINIGYRDIDPYSYKTSDGHVVGYVIDLCKDVTESLKRELHLNNLVVNYVPAPLTMRTTMLNHNIIDMDCSFNTDTVKRESMVLFSHHYLSVNTRFGMQAGNKIRSSTDLAGRTISVTKGSTDLINLNRLNRLQKLNLLILSQPSIKESFDAMSNRKSYATVMNEVSLKEFIESSANPMQYAVSREVLGAPLDLGIMMRHGDTELKRMVDYNLAVRFKRADFKQFYDKWFNSNLPDRNINLHLPLTSEMHKYLIQ
ncbi:transporter substrate-binding domain-containing protein [Buttiauxella sp. B2]|uniref:transporter substrate-binding domain-containing protein n=1 Tax=Buttiauxella sp. B2 TaxID=2587812 RepID=UPI0011240F8B|nr:transporter substrate-binding domain-containing protein [Buttiauxella sp. B2]TNV22198.1 transporter substrate-binding domain-containing protein [Buttiauxella sp. B2]